MNWLGGDALYLRLTHIGIGVICWIVLAVKTADLLRNPGNRGLRSLVGVCLGMSVALTVGLPPIYALIDRLTHVPNLGKLLQHLATIGACCAISVMLVRLENDRPGAGARVRRRIVFAGAVAVAMAVLFLLAPVDVSEPIEFADRYSTAPFIPQYMFLFIAMIALACADIAVSVWRYGRRPRSAAYLRLSGLLVFGAALSGVAYCGFKAFYIVAQFTRSALPMDERFLSTPLALTAVVLGAVGLALPKVGTLLETVSKRLGYLRAYRRLHPLWSRLHAAMPEIALHRPRGREPLAFFDIEYRLYRRVIEISDGMLALGVAGLAQDARPDAA
ncbi:MAB_1171c family putative transporter [Nonomuraea purpurea]|uniref:MAB_1171c family putative transporter n=1 Tax=Nonomuraea purpurea TaxID=1849276 RepID=A0ABV8GFC1_9ACTN